MKMITIDSSFESIVLKTRVNVKIYLPNPENFMNPVEDYLARYTFSPFRTVFLLHGMMDSALQWVENTNIVRLAEDAGLALVIPSCGNNYYVNTVYGAEYSDFISRELPGFVRGLFPLSRRREDNYLWGISMGGYGVLRQGFINPELFSKIVAMSPTSDIEFSARFATAMGIPTKYILGDWKTLNGSDMDLRVMAEKAVKNGADIPDLLFIIADQDHMVRNQIQIRDCINALGIRNDFRTYPGDHTWAFWDSHVKECIDWIIGQEKE